MCGAGPRRQGQTRVSGCGRGSALFREIRICRFRRSQTFHGVRRGRRAGRGRPAAIRPNGRGGIATKAEVPRVVCYHAQAVGSTLLRARESEKSKEIRILLLYNWRRATSAVSLRAIPLRSVPKSRRSRQR